MSFHSATPPTSPDEKIQISNNPFYQFDSRNSCRSKQIGYETSRTKPSLLPTPPKTKNTSKLFIHSSQSDAFPSHSSSSPPTSPETELSSSSKATRKSRSTYQPIMSFELAPALENGLCPPPEIVEFPWSTRSKRDTGSCATRPHVDTQFLFTSSSFTPPLCSPADSCTSADATPIASSSLGVPDYFSFSPSSSNQTSKKSARPRASSPPLTPLKTPPIESGRRPKRSMPTREKKLLVRNNDPKKGPIWDAANPFLEGMGMAWKSGDETESESEWDGGAKRDWLKRQRIGEEHEKPTIGYVFRGTKTTFANPHYGSSQSISPEEHPLTHPDFSPPSNPRPRLLFPPQTTPRRSTMSLSNQLQSMTRTSARPVFDSDDDDDDKGMLMATPRKLFTSTVSLIEPSTLTVKPRTEEVPRWSLSESTPRSGRSSNTALVSPTNKGLDVGQKRNAGLQQKSNVKSTKRGSESIGIDSLGRSNYKRLRY